MKTHFWNFAKNLSTNWSNFNTTQWLTSKPWLIIGELGDPIQKCIFHTNNTFSISIDGNARKYKWELMGEKQIMIHHNESIAELFNIYFYDNEFLILQKDETNKFAFLIDGQNSNRELQISFVKRTLEQKYSSDGGDKGGGPYISEFCKFCGQPDINHLGQCPRCMRKLI